ncbi:MAG TPA: hypothetical protein VMU55_01815 [Solirubrobacteraceae bacterium]|nr:hypothetical protein [Solirubrobacteraceae bacterium]
MYRLLRDRVTVWSGALLIAVVIAASAAAVSSASKAHSTAAPVVSNGGAKQWIAFDPDGRSIGPVQFLSKTISIVSTSTGSGKYSIYYEPQHLLICAGTIGGGGNTLCGVQPTTHLSGGYFQVISATPVLMGGRSEVPTLSYSQEKDGTYVADTSKGTIQNIPLVWQQGCPPRRGTGCPVSALPTNTGVKKVSAKK